MRLGGRQDDADPVKQHSFFKNINWDDVIHKRLEPPFKPKLSSEDDVSQFDSKFTEQMPIDSPEESSHLSKSINEMFVGFTYVAPSVLEELNRSSMNNHHHNNNHHHHHYHHHHHSHQYHHQQHHRNNDVQQQHQLAQQHFLITDAQQRNKPNT
ncbi:hypothetical protein SSS_06424 [Sarcoptes scabiei]|nr:hypothetical protein SSS_06424 [Sarcoptes scabiei]